MASVYTLSSAIDLTAPTTNIGTTTPPAIIVSTLFRSANSGNVPAVFQAFGTGAFQLQPADSTAVGGNARGANAIDLQTLRSAATQVANGLGSFVAGANNTASGTYSVALGVGSSATGFNDIAMGNSASATGGGAFAVGTVCIASGNGSIALGAFTTTKGVTSLLAVGNNIDNNAGKGQTTALGLGVITTDATPTVLKSSTAGASAANQLTLQNNSAIAFTAVLTGTITGAGNTTSFQFQGCIKRGANAASTVLVGAITPVLISRDAGAAAWTVAVTADTTNGCLAVSVTGQAATTIRWNCSIFASEVAF